MREGRGGGERKLNVDRITRGKKVKRGKEVKKSVTEKVPARRSSATVLSVCTQSSRSIGATALTAWAPRNPINKYYNGTPREVGAQHILLLVPTSTLVPSLPTRAPSSRPVIFILLLVASRRKKDLSYVALPQPLHSSYTRLSARPRPRPRNFVSHLVVRYSSAQTPGPRFRCLPRSRRTVRHSPGSARAPAGVSRSLSAFFSSSRGPPPATTRPFTGPRAHHRLHFTFLVAN